MKKYSYIILMATALFAASCSSEDSSDEGGAAKIPYEVVGKVVLDTVHEFDAEKLNGAMTPEENAVAKATNKFGFELFDMMSTDGENCILSPLSVVYAFSMATNGAGGDTRTEMLKAMKLNSGDMDALNAFNYKKMAYYKSCEEKNDYEDGETLLQINVSNSLWMNPSLLVYNSYVNDCKNYYASDVYNTVDNDKINAWISDATKGLITKLNIPESTIIALINATYFKGSWSHSFEKRLTDKATFYNSDGTEQQVDMMHNLEKYRYTTTDNASILAMPYGNKANASMYLVLPKDGVALKDVCNEETLEAALSANNYVLTKLSMPKFEIRSRNSLVKSLEAMGCQNTFNAGADFSNQSPDKLHISDIFSEAVVKVDEKGTTAAAITAVMEAISFPGGNTKPIVIDVNHPFLFFIADKQGTLMFIGKVENL